MHKKKSREEWISKFREVHGNTYSYEKFQPAKPTETCTVTCKIHGDFQVRANCHSYGQGCKQCRNKQSGIKRTKSRDMWIKEFRVIHGDRYNYDKFEPVNCYTKTIVTCKIHGDFTTTPNVHQQCGCPKCKLSKGEIAVQNFLDKFDVKYTMQHRFDECRDKLPLPFDFYLTELNVAIEFQGHQHYFGVGWSGKGRKLEYIQSHDKIKKDYCDKNNITLITIKYDESVEDKLKSSLNL